jgi:DNA modification methylase
VNSVNLSTGNCTFQRGDCRKVLTKHDANHYTACVTDPPYGIREVRRTIGRQRYSTKEWQRQVAFQPETWDQVYRVLRPGAYLLSFGSPRTYHRLAVAVEDAGFEIVDCLLWLHSGLMPKTRSIYKELERKLLQLGEYDNPIAVATQFGEWAQYGTGLKPCWTPILVARKFSGLTHHETAVRHGVAGFNTTATSIPCNPWDKGMRPSSPKKDAHLYPAMQYMPTANGDSRHPTNVLLDAGTQEMLDHHTATSREEREYDQRIIRPVEIMDGKFGKVRFQTWPHVFQRLLYHHKIPLFGSPDSKTVYPVSRFFYCPPASQKDRGKGNIHPTVKPVPLMKYLVTLVTYPSGNCLLDPFCGSGSTLVAVRHLQMANIDIQATGIDTSAKYLRIAKRRVDKVSTGN